jgi:hypothetical protein
MAQNRHDSKEHIEISVDIKQVKIHDDILQGCEAMTVQNDEKVTMSVILA